MEVEGWSKNRKRLLTIGPSQFLNLPCVVSTSGANFAPGQHDKGRGCFKCGEVGHFAKECPNNGEDQKEGAPERPKYSIKETGGQRGNMSRR